MELESFRSMRRADVEKLSNLDLWLYYMRHIPVPRLLSSMRINRPTRRVAVDHKRLLVHHPYWNRQRQRLSYNARRLDDGGMVALWWSL